MTDEDVTALVTSIDENDIEIISSDGSEIDHDLDFINEHFSVDERNVNRVNFPIPSINSTVRLTREDSEDFEDETFIERLYGLTEMFPEWLQRVFVKCHHYSICAGKFIKNSIWFCSTSFIVLLLPVFIQFEIFQVAESEATQARQILLGSSAQIGSSLGTGAKSM